MNLDGCSSFRARMHVRVWLHETKASVSGSTQDNFFLTGTAMAVPAVVAATALIVHVTAYIPGQ